MQAAVSNAVTNDLMAIKAHLSTCPSHVPGNLIVAVSWDAIGELYHVSQSPLYLWIRVLNPAFQRNMLCWVRVDPPWELPDYIGDLAQALQDTRHGSCLVASLRTWWWWLPLLCPNLSPLVTANPRSRYRMGNSLFPRCDG